MVSSQFAETRFAEIRV